MEVDEAVAALMDDPQAFLANNALQIAGGAALTSDLRIFYLQFYRTVTYAVSGPGWAGTKTVAMWQAVVTQDTSQRFLRRYMLGTVDVAEFRAYYVSMRQIEEDVATTHYNLPSAGGPDLMLTSQLTGCTFGYGSQAPGGTCLVSHIQPAGDASGKRAPGALTPIGKRALRTAVAGPMGQNATVVETDGTAQTTVVGHRTGGVWAFYKQVQDPLTRTLTTRVAGI